MFHTIRVFSRDKVQDYAEVTQEKVAIISISNSDKPNVVFPGNENVCATLKLKFFDVESDLMDSKIGNIINTISDQQARQIAVFAYKVKDSVDAITVHCNAGQSRSPAIAAAISRHFFGSTKNFLSGYIPNRNTYLKTLAALESINSTGVNIQKEEEAIKKIPYNYDMIDWE